MAATKTKPLGAIPDKIMRAALMVELADTQTVKLQDGKTKMFRKARLVAMSMVNAAIKGDVGAGKLIFDRADGKLVQEIAGVKDAPIVHEHVTAPVEKTDYGKLSLEQLVDAHQALTIAAAAANATKH